MRILLIKTSLVLSLTLAAACQDSSGAPDLAEAPDMPIVESADMSAPQADMATAPEDLQPQADAGADMAPKLARSYRWYEVDLLYITKYKQSLCAPQSFETTAATGAAGAVEWFCHTQGFRTGRYQEPTVANCSEGGRTMLRYDLLICED